MHPDSVNSWLDKLNARHPELPKINPHAFRHSMATTLLANGMDIVGVSRRLGHAKPSTTVNIYAHLVDESDKKTPMRWKDCMPRRDKNAPKSLKMRR